MHNSASRLKAILGTFVMTASLVAGPPERDDLPSIPVIRVDPPARARAMAPRLYEDAGVVRMTWFERVGNPGVQPEEEGWHIWRLRTAALDDAWQWSQPVTISQSGQFVVNWADFPSICATSDGTILGNWLERSSDGFTYDVILTRSDDGGRSWSRLGKAHDDYTQTEHGFVSFVPTNDGAVWTFWLDGREMTGGHGHDAQGAMTLRAALIDASGISQPAILDHRVCECCNTAATMTNSGPIITYRDRGEDELRDISIVRRTEDGWSEPAPIASDGWTIAGCPVNGPAIDAHGDLVTVAWFTSPDSDSQVKAVFSNDGGRTFNAPIVIDAAAANGSPMGRVSVVFDEDGETAFVGWLDQDESAQVDEDYSVGGAAFRIQRVGPDGMIGDPFTVTAMDASRASGFPQLVRRNGHLIMAWTETVRPFHVRVAYVPASAIGQ